MEHRRHDDHHDDRRNRAREEHESGDRDYRTTSWRPRAYDQPHTREDYTDDRFRAGSTWDQERRDSERAPGRARDDYTHHDDGQHDRDTASGES